MKFIFQEGNRKLNLKVGDLVKHKLSKNDEHHIMMVVKHADKYNLVKFQKYEPNEKSIVLAFDEPIDLSTVSDDYVLVSDTENAELKFEY